MATYVNMNQEKPKILFPAGFTLEVVGNVASGKTTLSKHLGKVSNFLYADLEIYTKNPFLPLYVNDPKRWAFQTGIQFSYERAKQINAVQKQREWDPVVLDQGFDMGIFVYSKTSFMKEEMIEAEWNLLQKMHEQLMKNAPEIDATVFLHVPVKTLMERMEIRGREHERYYSLGYVEQLQQMVDAYKQDMVALKKRKVIATYHQLTGLLEFHGKMDPKIAKLFS